MSGVRVLMSFRPARSKRLYEEVVDQVLELIAAGELRPGGRLPSERDLADQVGVSRNVLREAFHVLEERGIVVSRAGDGRYVRPVNERRSQGRDGSIGSLETATIEDILESREILEMRVVSLACERIGTDEVPRLREAAGRTDTWQDNVEFHAVLASATHNYMLERLVRQQLELLDEVHQRDHYASVRVAKELLEEHSEMAEAVISRDVTKAQTLMEAHLVHTRRGLGLI